MYWIVYLIVLFIGLAMTVREGLWSNAITLINILISGLVAFGVYSPIVLYLDEEVTDGQHTYWLDFCVLWAVFAATMVVCRTASGAASKTRMRFKNPIDPIGGPLVGFIAAWFLAAFTLATLHVAPAPTNAFSGKLMYNSAASESAVMAPDAAWLRLVERVSQPAALGSSGTVAFSADAFVSIYKDRRAKFEKATKLVVPRG